MQFNKKAIKKQFKNYINKHMTDIIHLFQNKIYLMNKNKL